MNPRRAPDRRKTDEKICSDIWLPSCRERIWHELDGSMPPDDVTDRIRPKFRVSRKPRAARDIRRWLRQSHCLKVCITGMDCLEAKALRKDVSVTARTECLATARLTLLLREKDII